ncbi:LCA5L protein, partial [Menura novaehollandiae]|nr:LCA5L protein [Menura novaehollandiae]
IYSGLNAGGRKRPVAKTPYLNSSVLTLQSGVFSQDKNATAQRISSARLHKIKELKNEIVDLQRKIEAASLENQALKELHRRHSKAIDRYKNSGSDFQDLLARHCDEMRELRRLLKMSQEAERNTSRELRKVEAELQKAKGALRTLLLLSEDKALAEREELNHRLSILNEKLEAKDERIQSLEMQLKLNNSTFTRQLASESKKLVEAGITTKNLKVEINSVLQKIKEKDRQLYVKNIYANRMPKILKDRSDSAPHEQSKSVQVDKESFRALLLSQLQETEKSLIQLIKEKKPSEDKDEAGKANEVCSDAQCKTEKQSTEKRPTPETSNRTHREYLREGRLLMEEYIFSEFMKEMGKETEFLKQELKNLMKTEQSPRSDSVKENNQEGDAGAEVEKKEKKSDKQQKKKARSECAIPKKEPMRLKKKYIFSEATENLHHGLHTSGTKSKAGSLCSLRQAGQGCSETAESRGRISFGVYEPSFGQVPPHKQKDGASGARGCTQVTFADRKKHLMKELFGEGCFQRDNHSSSNTRGMKTEK